MNTRMSGEASHFDPVRGLLKFRLAVGLLMMNAVGYVLCATLLKDYARLHEYGGTGVAVLFASAGVIFSIILCAAISTIHAVQRLNLLNLNDPIDYSDLNLVSILGKFSLFVSLSFLVLSMAVVALRVFS